MSTVQRGAGPPVERARAWRRAFHAGVCDSVERWDHGAVLRASRYPSYWDLNVVRVEDEPGMSVIELVAFADEALAGVAHRRVDFEDGVAAGAWREGFEELGWRTMPLLWMRHEHPLPPAEGPEIEVEPVPYEDVIELRRSWHREDFDDDESAEFEAAAREVAESRGVSVLAVREGERPIAFAQLERAGAGAEITQVYVEPRARGRGFGTAMTRAAIIAAGEVEDLWIVADDEGRPKQLYERLGFRPVWRATEFLRVP